MNRIIPNGSVCLFRRSPEGSRNGKIVLVESTDLQDDQSGSRYTVKEYESLKHQTDEGWVHQRIRLKPRSTDPSFQTIELTPDKADSYQIIGEFVCVIR